MSQPRTINCGSGIVLLIKQYSISEETFRFYEQLKATTEELGTLFDPIPTEVIGNVRNTGNPDETVLGFFSADGYDSQRIFIDKAELNSVFVPDGFQACLTDTLFTDGGNGDLCEPGRGPMWKRSSILTAVFLLIWDQALCVAIAV